MFIIYSGRFGKFFGCPKRSFGMYSPEFMKFLINYQKPEYNESVNKKVHYFRFSLKDRILASVLLLSKK